MEMSGNDLVVGAVFTRTRSRASLSITRLDFYRWNSAHHESSHLNHSGWFLLLKICTSWIRTKSLIFYIAHPHIIFHPLNTLSQGSIIAHVQFFPLQVPFSPKFEADFWPDERLEQASILVTLFFRICSHDSPFQANRRKRNPQSFGSSFKSPFNLQVLPSIQRLPFNQIFQ